MKIILQSIICLVSLLLFLPFVNAEYYDAAEVSYYEVNGVREFGDLNVTGGIDKEAKFLVYSDGSTYSVYNGHTNKKVSSGSDAATQIQYALDNLTAGRSAYEKVVVVGDFPVSAALTTDDYTYLGIVGSIKLDTDVNTQIITNSDPAGGNSNIILEGGVIDGNYTAQTGIEKSAIKFVNVSNFIIRNIEVKNAGRHGVAIENGSHDFQVSDVNSHNNGDDSFTTLTGVYNGIFTNIRGTDGRSAAGSSAAMEIEDGSYNLQVNGIFVDNMAIGAQIYPGCIIITADGTQTTPYNITITNMYCKAAGRNGVQISSTVATYVKSVKIIGGVIEDAGLDGISITGSKYIDIIGVKVKNSANEGIMISSSSSHINITNNEVLESSGFGIRLSDVTYVRVTGNYVYNNGQDNTWRAGIRITNTDATDPGYNFISGNRVFDDQGTKTQYYGIGINNTTQDIIKDNVIYGNNIAPMDIGTLGTLYIKNNNGYTLSATALTADDTTPSVGVTNSQGKYIFTIPDNTVATAITDLDNPPIGKTVTLIGLACPTNCATIADSGNFNLTAGWTQATDASITLYIQADNDYIEVSRVAP